MTWDIVGIDRYIHLSRAKNASSVRSISTPLLFSSLSSFRCIHLRLSQSTERYLNTVYQRWQDSYRSLVVQMVSVQACIEIQRVLHHRLIYHLDDEYQISPNTGGWSFVACLCSTVDWSKSSASRCTCSSHRREQRIRDLAQCIASTLFVWKLTSSLQTKSNDLLCLSLNKKLITSSSISFLFHSTLSNLSIT